MRRVVPGWKKSSECSAGVTSCSVSLLTNSMGVEGNAAEDTIIEAVQNAGYGAKIKGCRRAIRECAESGSTRRGTCRSHHAAFAKALAVVGLLLLVLMYFLWGI